MLLLSLSIDAEHEEDVKESVPFDALSSERSPRQVFVPIESSRDGSVQTKEENRDMSPAGYTPSLLISCVTAMIGAAQYGFGIGSTGSVDTVSLLFHLAVFTEPSDPQLPC